MLKYIGWILKVFLATGLLKLSVYRNQTSDFSQDVFRTFIEYIYSDLKVLKFPGVWYTQNHAQN